MIISLTGGLGNQLFQYFAGLYFCRDIEKLLVTTSFGEPRRTCGIPDLEFFSLDDSVQVMEVSTSGRLAKKFANLALTRNLSKPELSASRAGGEFLDLILPIFFSTYLRTSVSIFSSDSVGYTSKIPHANSLVFGYFQSYKYFSSLPYQKRELNLKRESSEFVQLKNRIILEKPLVVHIRLGDYLTEKHFGVLSKEYYARGIRRFEREDGETKIWLFSDNSERALRMLPEGSQEKVFVVPSYALNPAESLELMRYSSRYLIANSSFSWWGAMLSYAENSKVKAPSKWFSGMEDPYMLIPANWELLTR